MCVGGGSGPQESVWGKGVKCSVSVDCVDVCAERGVFWNGGEGVKFCLIELGCSGVWRTCSRSARRGTSEVVEGVCWVFGGGVNVCASHTHVLFEW